MGSFSCETKTSCDYLDIAANGNGAEKAMLTLKALQFMRLDGRDSAHTTEIGPGGGAAFSAVTEAMDSTWSDQLPSVIDASFIELDDISSESLTVARKRHEDSGHGQTSMIRGNARELSTLIPDSTDIVTASAVLHEIYSYSGGYDGINDTLREITQTLRPGGYFAYRDVFAVDADSQHERTRHIYDNSWVYFSKLFLPYYLQNATHPYHREDDKVIFEQDSNYVKPEAIDPEKNLSIGAPVGLLRELQRHYIMLRDFCWRRGSLGFIPVLDGELANDWIDQRNGHRRVYYSNTPGTPDDTLLTTMSEEAGDGLLKVDGDYFDATSDAELTEFLKAVLNEDSPAMTIWNEWLEREGSETYVYMTIGRLLGSAALRSLEATNGRQVLLPTSPSEVVITPRGYYNRFLRKQLSTPLRDAKQLILFRSYDPRTQQDEIASSLGALTDHCTKDTISRIYGPIRKAS